MNTLSDVSDLRSVRFRTEREDGWKQLETLVLKAEKSGMAGLSFDDLAVKPVSQDDGDIKSSGALLLDLLALSRNGDIENFSDNEERFWE